MMRRCVVLLCVGLLAGCSDAEERSDRTGDSTSVPQGAATPAPGDPPVRDSAFYALRVYPLDSFPQIPSEVRAAFMAIGCGEIPQTYTSRAPGNVVQGEFSAAGQTDWAALCHRNGTTELTVVWGGPSKCSSRIWPSPSGSDRFIALATMDDILRHAKTYDGPQPPARDHAGIHDGVAEKASTIRFCHQGQWIELYGAD
jgi:hypothetical protein